MHDLFRVTLVQITPIVSGIDESVGWKLAVIFWSKVLLGVRGAALTSVKIVCVPIVVVNVHAFAVGVSNLT